MVDAKSCPSFPSVVRGRTVMPAEQEEEARKGHAKESHLKFSQYVVSQPVDARTTGCIWPDSLICFDLYLSFWVSISCVRLPKSYEDVGTQTNTHNNNHLTNLTPHPPLLVKDDALTGVRWNQFEPCTHGPSLRNRRTEQILLVHMDKSGYFANEPSPIRARLARPLVLSFSALPANSPFNFLGVHNAFGYSAQ